MRVVALAGAAAAAAAVFLAACGRTEGGAGGEGAALVPADVAVFVAVNTDFHSEQWGDAEDLLERFPEGRELLRRALDDPKERDAVGPETDFVVLEVGGERLERSLIVLTQPPDRERYLGSLDDDVVTAELEDGWIASSDHREALDAFLEARKGEKLADSDAFQDAMTALEGDALAKVFVNAEDVQEQLSASDFGRLTGVCSGAGELVTGAAALRAEEDGVHVDATSNEQGGEELETYEAGLLDELPAGAAVYFSFNDLARQFRETRDQLGTQMPELNEELDEAERFLGVDLENDVLPLLEGEGALAVYTHSLIPTVTLVVEVDDEERAVATVDEIVARFGDARETEIAGVPAKEVPVEQLSLLYAAFDGKLVLTTTAAGIEDLRDDGTKLGDDERFREATDAAGMPDDTSGFVYVDADEAVGLVEALAAFEGEEVPSDVRENLEPLDTAVLYGSDDDVCFSAFLGID